MKREHDILRALHGVFPYCPEPLAFCDDDSILGCPFFVMERLEGVIIRRDIPAELELSPTDVTDLFSRLVDVFVELHAVDHSTVGLYRDRQAGGIRRTADPGLVGAVPPCEDAGRARLRAGHGVARREHPPESNRVSVIHNDFRLDNIVLDPDDPLRIVGVLDWEMATVGDPLMDLGATLAYWVRTRRPTREPTSCA